MTSGESQERAAPTGPQIDRFCRHFDAYTWVAAPNPLSVWVAEVSGTYQDFAFNLFITGDSEAAACQRFERFLAEVTALAARPAPPSGALLTQV
jgi:DNA-binding SARP family transcriptional activator